MQLLLQHPPLLRLPVVPLGLQLVEAIPQRLGRVLTNICTGSSSSNSSSRRHKQSVLVQQHAPAPWLGREPSSAQQLLPCQAPAHLSSMATAARCGGSLSCSPPDSARPLGGGGPGRTARDPGPGAWSSTASAGASCLASVSSVTCVECVHFGKVQVVCGLLSSFLFVLLGMSDD